MCCTLSLYILAVSLPALPVVAWLPSGRTSIPSALFPTPGSNAEQITELTLGDKYLLCRDPQESSSGKSTIYKAYEKCSSTGQPIGDGVVIKVSDDTEALERETENFDKLDNELFIDTKEYLEPVSEDDDIECEILQENGALVMECGVNDLEAYVKERGALAGDELRCIARRVMECVRDMHDKGFVWTELKTSNFVLLDCGTVKGIDVESAVKHRGHPIDFTPKACPPEFAFRFLCGTEPWMEMEYSFDVWSLGMLLYELATGENYWGDENEVEVCKHLMASIWKRWTMKRSEMS